MSVALGMEQSPKQELVGPRKRRTRHGHSRRVTLLKLLLPSAAAVVVGMLVAWPQLSLEDQKFQLGFADLSPGRADTLTMDSPRFFGSDSQRRLFMVTADIARQMDAESNEVALEAPKADLVMPDGNAVLLDAAKGYYRQNSQILDLLGGVILKRDGGYEFETGNARVHVAEGSAEGDSPIYGRGPFGTIEGDGFRMHDRGSTIIFTGRAKAVIQTQGQAEAPADPSMDSNVE